MPILARSPRGLLVRDGELPLRPILIAREPHYFHRERLYPAPVLIEYLLAHEFDTDPGMPDPVPFPDAMATLPDEVAEVLRQHCAGEEVAPHLAVEVRTRLIMSLARAGITLLPAIGLTTLITSIQFARLRRIAAETEAAGAEAETNTINTQAEESIARGAMTPAMVKLAYGTDYHVVAPAPTEEFERMLNRPDPVRRRWPWAGMQPGDRVVIPASQAMQAQNAVHAYASYAKRKFRTERRLSTRDLLVYRVA